MPAGCLLSSGRRITAITLASQAKDVGSTPIARSKRLAQSLGSLPLEKMAFDVRHF